MRWHLPWLVLSVACAPAADPTEATAPPGEAPAVQSISGSATWDVEFDDTAKTGGAVDCSYTRTYVGSEDRSAPWLCPDCTAVFRADVQMSDPDRACYDQISAALEPSEWLGYSDETWFREQRENFALAPQGEVDWSDDTLLTSYETDWERMSTPGRFKLTVTGAYAISTGGPDPLFDFRPPADAYACGWPRLHPARYPGPWALREGEIVPDGWFQDVCEESLRLHDLKGAYLVIEISARDCPPCQEMARTSHLLKAAMPAGAELEIVTLLAPSLGGVLDPTSTRQLQEWIDAFEVDHPVLADRGWGFWLGTDALGAPTFGYPMVIVVDRQLRVLDIDTGFGGWEPVQGMILADYIRAP